MSIFKDIKNVVDKVAPTLGSALGGPLAGSATKFIAEKLLGKPEASDKDIEQTLAKASPDQLLKLKELDKNFATQMSQLDIDVFKMEVQDRQSARDLFKTNIWPQITLSALFVGGYFVILFIMFEQGGKIDPANRWLQGVFTTVLGVLTASVPQILNFWFGSSMGSKEKTKGMIAQGLQASASS